METQTQPGYEVGKIAEKKWGVFYRLDERTSFGPKAVYRSRREAKADAQNRNLGEKLLALEAKGAK